MERVFPRAVQIEVTRTGDEAAPYRVRWDGQDYTLVRSVPRHEVLRVMDSRMNYAKIAGHKTWTDQGGELRSLPLTSPDALRKKMFDGVNQM